MKVLEVFRHRIVMILTGRMAYCVGGGVGGGECPPEEESIEAEGMWSMQEYVRSQQTKIAEYIATCPIFELCNGEERVLGSS